MVYFQKSPAAPECLAAEKAKSNGTYRCEGVAEQLRLDFKNKCYLCETASPTSINIEHFVMHRGDRDLMFDWGNLYYCCTHCNAVKQMMNHLTQILDCTKIDDQVDEVIRYEMYPFPGEIVNIDARNDHPKTLETAALLLGIYNNAQTEQKRIESGNLRQQLLREVKRFQLLVQNYSIQANEDQKSSLKRRIIRHLQNDSSFTAFKRWIIRDHPALMAEFEGTWA